MEGQTCMMFIMLAIPLMQYVKGEDCHSDSRCSVTCGTGTERFKCFRLECGGERCPVLRRVKRGVVYYEYKKCDTGRCCRVDCEWGSWNRWESCSKTCEGGTRKRTRNYDRARSCGGSSCSGPSTDTETCNKDCCPVDCEWGSWETWETCSKTCGGGTRERTRDYDPEKSCDGSSCLGSSTDSEDCNEDCCPVDCTWGEWGTFGNCNQTCGGGTRVRTRKEKEEECYGTPCSESSTDLASCNEHCCPVNCDWDEWGSWGSCSSTCGSGTKTRTRSKSVESSCGGSCNGSSLNSTSCNPGCCPVNCVWGNWNTWGSCSKTCGTGTRTRDRPKVMNETCKGACQGQNSDSQTCNTNCCPISCTWRQWSAWGACEDSCGASIKRRTREENPAVCGGELCQGETEESQPCDADIKNACPVNCEWSLWSPWNSCSVSCGAGEKKRLRTKHVVEKNGGACSGNSKESEICEMNMNPTDCVLGGWSSWGDCQGSCETGGIKVRSRKVTVNGTACGKQCDTNQLDPSACHIAGCLGTTSKPEDGSLDDSKSEISSGLSSTSIIIIGVAGLALIVIVVSIVAVICCIRKKTVDGKVKARPPSAPPAYDDLKLDRDVSADNASAYTELEMKETAVYAKINK